MASSMRQINLTYDQINDRLLLNFSTQDFQEYRFWITRRVLKGFWTILQQVINSYPREYIQNLMAQQHPEERVKQEVQIAEANKYATRLTRRPLGEEPLLLCKISATPQTNGQVVFRFEDFQGNTVDFNGDAFLVTLLIQLIVKIHPKTEWNLNLSEQI